MPLSIAELNHRFAIPGVATVVAGNGGLPKVQITTAAATGEMYLHGGHVTSWKPSGGREVFFLSPHSLYQEGKAIRGGVPVCFPWFGDKADDSHAPAHGFVRTKRWELQSIERSGDAVSVSMATTNDEGTRQWWPQDFRLLHRVTFGSELFMELIVTNTDAKPQRFQEALHAYYSVGDATRASISGLDGVRYLDKTDTYREKAQAGDIMIEAETDRVYLNTSGTLHLSDPVLQRQTTVAKQNSRTTVVWNPWSEKARDLPDLGEDQWKSMLCIEVTNVGDFAVDVAPGQTHTMVARVRVAS
jgi:glucose-6-phosphate 1-epimerase